MNILAVLIPASVFLGLLGLVAFLWLVRHDQFEDPEGHAARILSDRYDDAPADDLPPRDRQTRRTGERPRPDGGAKRPEASQ